MVDLQNIKALKKVIKEWIIRDYLELWRIYDLHIQNNKTKTMIKC